MDEFVGIYHSSKDNKLEALVLTEHMLPGCKTLTPPRATTWVEEAGFEIR
jgi:hypothetical protein